MSRRFFFSSSLKFAETPSRKIRSSPSKKSPVRFSIRGEGKEREREKERDAGLGILASYSVATGNQDRGRTLETRGKGSYLDYGGESRSAVDRWKDREGEGGRA